MTEPRFCFDEDVNAQIIRGLRRRRLAGVHSWTTVRDEGLAGSADPELLAWAAEQGFVIVTHDVNTMVRHALARIDRGQLMSGLIIVPQLLAVGAVIGDLEVILDASEAQEWHSVIAYLPL